MPLTDLAGIHAEFADLGGEPVFAEAKLSGDGAPEIAYVHLYRRLTDLCHNIRRLLFEDYALVSPIAPSLTTRKCWLRHTIV
jgi:hypothetical protein